MGVEIMIYTTDEKVLYPKNLKQLRKIIFEKVRQIDILFEDDAGKRRIIRITDEGVEYVKPKRLQLIKGDDFFKRSV